MALTKQIKNDNVAIQNANAGINLIHTADSAVDSITSPLQSLNEQTANGTLNPSQRGIINEQFQMGLDSINQLVNVAQFNDINLLDGSNTEIDITLDGDNIKARQE